MPDAAILLATGLLQSIYAKTSHGLIRGPSRYRIVGVVDPACAGQDAGELLDGVHRGIPVAASVRELLDGPGADAKFCVIGVATEGGVIPQELRNGLLDAAAAGLTLINGLHQLLTDDDDLVRATDGGARIVDLRRPRPTKELRFWTGEIKAVAIPRLAVLGTDCALGKRTTTALLAEALRERGVNTEMIYTGQTGWLQGGRFGFIFDATPNDFVSGELEGAILDCAKVAQPDLMLLEGQSALRNPSGPCGAEFIISAAAAGVVLQHAPGRTWFEALGELDYRIPPLSEEIELIRLLGSEVWALTLNHEGLDDPEATRAALASEFGLPAALPLKDLSPVVDVICQRLGVGK